MDRKIGGRRKKREKGGGSLRKGAGTGNKHARHNRRGRAVPVCWRVSVLFFFSPAFGPFSLFSRFRGFFFVSLFSVWRRHTRCVPLPMGNVARLAALLWWPGLGPASSFFSSSSFSLSCLSTPCRNLCSFRLFYGLPVLFDGLGLVGCHLDLFLVLARSRLLYFLCFST